ncbi:MAG TPA: hypothetical protein VGJ54_06545 [Streptosporangiaceae bacterium]
MVLLLTVRGRAAAHRQGSAAALLGAIRGRCWRLVMPTLARDFSVVAPDQRYRAVRQTRERVRHWHQTGDMVALMEALGHRRFAMVGVDTGLPIAYT